MGRSAVLTVLVLLPALTHELVGQRRAPSESSSVAAEPAAITVAAKIGKKSYRATGSGSCRHAPDASIRDVSASLWIVQYANEREGGLKQLSLTLWRPKDGSPDRLSLSLETSSGSHQIQTGQEGKNAGEGTVTVLPSGPGGRLEITGKDDGGKALQVTIDCPAFAGIEAEGG
jgi:hypothetical protein